MKRLSVTLGAFVVMLMVVVPVTTLSAAPALADPTHVPLCPGGDAIPVSGTYNNLRISAREYVSKASLVVTGNLTIAPGACLDAFSLATVRVGHNVFVEKGATLALGCSPGALGPPAQAPCFTSTTTDSVGGNIVASQPYSLYLTADSIGGNVISNGGGPGLGVPPAVPLVTFPIKENTIGGNLILEGWQGGWMGAIRNTVGGNMVYSGNDSVADPDSNEVVTNTVGGNLVCAGNSPAVQFGDSGGSPDVVGGSVIGQCTAVSSAPAATS